MQSYDVLYVVQYVHTYNGLSRLPNHKSCTSPQKVDTLEKKTTTSLAPLTSTHTQIKPRTPPLHYGLQAPGEGVGSGRVVSILAIQDVLTRWAVYAPGMNAEHSHVPSLFYHHV
jgi:hypothetical protein